MKNYLLFFFILSFNSNFSQSNPSKFVHSSNRINNFLGLNGQARLDSIEVLFASDWDEMDSTAAFKEIDFVKKYAQKTDDKLLSIFSDYIKIRYFVGKKTERRKTLYSILIKLQENLNKQDHSLIQERLNADFEHYLGLLLYFENKVSGKAVNHFLKSDLYYRKKNYENIIFACNKLSHIGLFYLDVVDDYETAFNYMKEAELHIKKATIDKHRISFYKNYANCLVKKKQYAEAIKYNKLAIAQVRLRRDSLKIGTISGNIGEIILNTFPNPIESEPYFQKELIYRLKFKPKGIEDITKVYGNLCQIAGLKHNREQMIQYFNKAIETIKPYQSENDIHNIMMSIYKNRMIADTLLGDYENAYRHERLFYEELMATNRQDLKVIISQASVKFDVEKNKLKVELANQQAQNSKFWVLTVSLLFIIALIGGYFLFINQRYKKNKLARQLLFEQKESERLTELNEFKTRFFTNISHEFRTPLTLLVGPIDDLQKKYPKEGIINVMQRNIHRLQSLINQLLDLSKLEAGEMKLNVQEINFSQFLGQLLASFESLAQDKKIIFNHSQSRLSQLGLFDLDKLEKIIINLLSNAFKFTPENGRISVRVEYLETEVIFKIQDSGIGIAPERLPHIFDRFYQVNGGALHGGSQHLQEGTGIGLSLVKELVDLLKGKIEVESKVGEGTSFILTLPFKSIENILKPSIQFVGKNSLKIVSDEFNPLDEPKINDDSQRIMLIVEDNPDLRNYIKSIFENQFILITAVDGEEGLIKAFEHIPDVIISDLMMPKLDGFGFCERVKSDERTNHIPVVMLTAKATIADKLIGLKHGADDYLSKPFNKEELIVRINNLVSQRQLLMQKKYANEIIPLIEATKELTMDELFIQKAEGIVDKYLDKSKFDVEKFADEMNLSSVQLRRKLKAVTDQTVTEFVRNYRLEIAAKMLKKKMGSVSEIAYKVGFESMPYFSKVFLEKYERTPSEWK
jgi:signal transduction histidine kinase/DNA-binding response OmpR family regulator